MNGRFLFPLGPEPTVAPFCRKPRHHWYVDTPLRAGEAALFRRCQSHIVALTPSVLDSVAAIRDVELPQGLAPQRNCGRTGKPFFLARSPNNPFRLMGISLDRSCAEGDHGLKRTRSPFSRDKRLATPNFPVKLRPQTLAGRQRRDRAAIGLGDGRNGVPPHPACAPSAAGSGRIGFHLRSQDPTARRLASGATGRWRSVER